MMAGQACVTLLQKSINSTRILLSVQIATLMTQLVGTDKFHKLSLGIFCQRETQQ